MMIMIIEYTKRVMHSAIAHHPLADAQPDSEQQPQRPANCLQVIY